MDILGTYNLLFPGIRGILFIVIIGIVPIVFSKSRNLRRALLVAASLVGLQIYLFSSGLSNYYFPGAGLSGRMESLVKVLPYLLGANVFLGALTFYRRKEEIVERKEEP